MGNDEKLNMGTRHTTYFDRNYYSVLWQFQPSNYDPDKWMKAAKEAGMSYAVITSKHHDGYAFWPGEYTNLGTKKYMEGRDLIRPYVDACRKSRKGKELYLHIIPGKQEEIRLKTDLKPIGAKLLQTNEMVKFNREGKYLLFDIPEKSNGLDDVIVVKWNQAP